MIRVLCEKRTSGTRMTYLGITSRYLSVLLAVHIGVSGAQTPATTSNPDTPSLEAAKKLLTDGRDALQHSNLAEAEKDFEAALAIYEKLRPDSLEYAGALLNLGNVASERRELAKTEEYFTRALQISQKVAPGSVDVARCLDNLAGVFWARGDIPKAEEYSGRALEVMRIAAPGTVDLALSLNHIGVLAKTRGDLAKSEEYYRQARALYEKLRPGTLYLAGVLNNLGNVYRNRGDLARAEECHRAALEIKEKLAPGSLQVAISLDNLGNVAMARGELAKAEDLHLRALAIEEKVAPNSLDVAESLLSLGAVLAEGKNFSRAEGYYSRALQIAQKVAPGSLDVANVLNNLGVVAKNRGDLLKAEEFGRQALEIFQKLSSTSLDVAEALVNLGSVAIDGDDLPKAENYYRRALEISEKLAPSVPAHTEALHSLGMIQSRRAHPEAASQYFGLALDSFESGLARLGGTESVRSGFPGEHMDYYTDALDTLLALKQSDWAFQVLERSRARSLLAVLAERDILFSADLPAEVQRARKLNGASYDRVQAQLLKLDPVRDAAQVSKMRQNLDELSVERDQIIERIKQISPRLAALQYPQPLDLPSTRQILDSGTLLLSYSVEKDRTVLFVVEPAGIEPGLSVFTLAVSDVTLRQKVEQFRKAVANTTSSGKLALADQGRELYNLLLRPAESQMEGAKRLMIIPDGPLHVLPFAALMRTEREYLIEWKPLHTVVSATVYAELRKPRPQTKGRADQVVAFGDPRYPAIDRSKSESIAESELRSTVALGFALPRLVFSREEVQGIAATFPGRTKSYLGAEATEERAKALGKDARYVHFATHGLLDERFPLNSALVLTIPESWTEGHENGLLQAWEVFDQVRLDADLVTLSACNTALGLEQNGEGLIGLSRAFLYAGARSVLASLWNVNDWRTAALMKDFYTHLKEGKNKDEALREAQIKLLRSRASAPPFYWAAFTLIGDWQ